MYSNPGGVPSPGKVRVWERTFPGGVDQRPQRIAAPWPWICAVNPGADDRTWYRNRDVVVPGNRRIEDVQFDLENEIGKVCGPIPDPNTPSAPPRFSCDYEQPPAGSGLIGSDCHSEKLPNAAAPAELMV